MAHLLVSAEQLARLIDRVRSRDEAYIVLISGASGSGKTTEAGRLVNHLDSLGAPLLRYRGRPAYVEMDMFYRDESWKQSEALGGNFDHPIEIDVQAIETVLDDLVEGKEVYLPVYSFREGRVVGRRGPLVPDENPVIVVEGIYAIGLLSHRSDLNVFVEAPSRLQLFARRLLRDVERTGREGEILVDQALTAMSMWNLYGEGQRNGADIILRSSYNVLEDKGRPSYQIKVPWDVFEREMPSTAKHLLNSPAARVEDLVIGDVKERMRGRLFFEGFYPSRFELSYRALIPSELPYTKSLKIGLSPRAYTAFVKLSQIMGYRPKIYYREIHSIKRGGILFKWYPERGIVEVETAEREGIEKYVKKFRGSIRFQSYYSR